MMGLPIGMMWPKVAEAMSDLCETPEYQGAKITLKAEGVELELPDGQCFVLPKGASYEEAQVLFEAFKNSRGG